MMKRLIPFRVAKSIYDINISFYQNHNIQNIFVDLDNTLDSYDQITPSSEARQLVKTLQEAKINVIIISNNTKRRVTRYAIELDVPFLYSLRKPFIYKMKRFLKKNKVSLEKSIIIGDQLITDILFANRLKIKNILTDKIVEKDQWTTKINRIFNQRVYRKLKKKDLLISWEKK